MAVFPIRIDVFISNLDQGHNLLKVLQVGHDLNILRLYAERLDDKILHDSTVFNRLAKSGELVKALESLAELPDQFFFTLLDNSGPVGSLFELKVIYNGVDSCASFLDGNFLLF